MQRYDAKVVGRRDLDDVGDGYGGVVLPDKGAEDVPEFLEQLAVTFEQRLREYNVVIAEERLVHF
eukprot:CAMPEP_0174738370 /NCGR_PEP_ID=MMETSP1094-20130205/69841_1 /TAXON_ID=156173 /ORGANISM="Chrysochromulina brevifilum, Strain UTEX LB 985" /LENGTH=64 /DNA_ID=CAMNT_0015941767 /DNA_START=253 /DNA_END=447 /DNA_ORIENTATION=+